MREDSMLPKSASALSCSKLDVLEADATNVS